MQKKSIYIIAGLALTALVAAASFTGSSEDLQGRFSMKSGPRVSPTSSVKPSSSSGPNYIALSEELNELEDSIDGNGNTILSFANTSLNYFESVNSRNINYETLESKYETFQSIDVYVERVESAKSDAQSIKRTANSGSGALASNVKNKANNVIDSADEILDEFEEIAEEVEELYNELYLPAGDLQVTDAELFIAGDYVVINASVKNNPQAGKEVRNMSPNAVNISGGLNLGSNTLYFAEKIEDTTVISSGQSTTVSVELYPYYYGSELEEWVSAYLAGDSNISADLKVFVDHDNDASEHNENNNELSTRISSF